MDLIKEHKLKKNILHWYPNQKNKKILQIGYVEEEIIEELCEKFNKVVIIVNNEEQKKKIKSELNAENLDIITDFAELKNNKFDLYVLAGYMRILPQEVLNLGTFVNIHPSLLPKFKGKNAIKRAFLSGEKETGVSIHYVIKEVDSGEIIAQQKCKIEPFMTLFELEEKIHKMEHKLYPKVIEELL